ncbi:MAG: hypothetical protein RIR71_815 [Actinomycetota bacterium]
MSSAAERRAKQTVRNLIYSMLVTLSLTVVIVLLVPRDDTNRIQPVDYVGITQTVQASVDQTLIAPKLETDWWVNAARVEKDLGVETWYVGYITPDDQYIGLTQAFESNPSWLANKLQGNWLDVTVEIEGRTWEIWPTLLPSVPKGTKEYAMVHSFGEQAVVIYGTASEADFLKLATQISLDLNETE